VDGLLYGIGLVVFGALVGGAILEMATNAIRKLFTGIDRD